MFKINENYLKLPGSYLFSTIGKKVAAYQQANPDKEIIRLGIGDVTQPLAPAVIDALHKSVDEMGHAETFHGYAPDLGYEFLRSVIADHDYKNQQHCGECRADYRHGVPEVPERAALLSLSGGLLYRLLLDPDVFDFLLVHTVQIFLQDKRLKRQRFFYSYMCFLRLIIEVMNLLLLSLAFECKNRC